MARKPEPPEHLSERARGLWRAVTDKTTTPGRAALIEIALQAYDEAEQASRLLKAEGLVSVTATSGAAHCHPAVKIEHDNRALFARLWLSLGFHEQPWGT